MRNKGESFNAASKSQIPYPRVFVYINTVDRGKTRNEAHRIDLKNVELNGI